jgi:hypothetical protein
MVVPGSHCSNTMALPRYHFNTKSETDVYDPVIETRRTRLSETRGRPRPRGLVPPRPLG